MLQKPQFSVRLMGHLARKQTLPFTLNRANLFLDYNNQIIYSLQYQIKYLHGCHRSGNGQEKKFFKVREMSGNLWCSSRKCPYSPHEGYLLNAPPLLPPPGNSSLFSYISSKNLAFKTPPPPGISNDLPWGGYGFFLEPHILGQGRLAF